MEPSLSNTHLVLRLKSGDETAFKRIFELYFDRLCAFSAQFVNSWEAEEIVHETIMWLWENRESLIPDLQVKSLLFAIVKNKCLNLNKHNHIKCQILEEIKYKFSNEFENPDFYVYDDLKTAFEKALIKLPEDYREAFVLNRFHNMKYQEIAQMKNISPKTVAYRICKALEILRKELKNYHALLFLLSL